LSYLSIFPQKVCFYLQSRNGNSETKTMPTELDTHRAPRPEPRPKLELPPIVRDYLENVRGAPEMSGHLAVDYLDSLWGQAIDFAKRNGVDCPVHKEEVDALRALVADRQNHTPSRAKPKNGYFGWRH
jgi:hypothetical protein